MSEDTIFLCPNEYALFKCPNDGMIQKIISNRESQGVKISDMKCRRCLTQMELCSPESVGWKTDWDGLYIVSTVSKENVLARQYFHQEEGEKLLWYWRLSPVWKAVHDHIDKSEPGKCYLLDKRWPTKGSSASSGVSLTKVYAFPAGSVDEHRFEVRFCFNVLMWDEDRHRDEERTGMVDVPAYLVGDFNQDVFNLWLDARKAKYLEQSRIELQNVIRNVAEMFPDFRDKVESGEIASMLREE